MVVRFPYYPIQLLCIHVSTLLMLTICEKKCEIAACIINVWCYKEILSLWLKEQGLNYKFLPVSRAVNPPHLH